MGVAVTTGAGMLFRRGMHAACELRGFVGVARLALDLGDVVGMRIFLDVGVAVVALQAAVNAGAEFVAIDGDAVPGGVLHGLVAVAAPGNQLARQGDGATAKSCESDKSNGATRRCRALDCPERVASHSSWTDKDCDQECCESCGFGHAAVFPPRSEQLRSRTWLSRSGFLRCIRKSHGGDCTSEETLFVIRLAVIVVTNAMKSKEMICFRDVTRATSQVFDSAVGQDIWRV